MKNIRLSSGHGNNTAAVKISNFDRKMCTFWQTILLFALLSFSMFSQSVNASDDFKQRYSTSAEKTRVVFEFPEEIGFSWQSIEDSKKIIISVVNPSNFKVDEDNDYVELSSAHITSIKYSSEDESNNLVIVLDLKDKPKFSLFDIVPTMDKGHRIIVDLRPNPNPDLVAKLPDEKTNVKKAPQEIKTPSNSESLDVVNEANKLANEKQKIVPTAATSSQIKNSLSANATNRQELDKKNTFLIVIDPGHGGVDLGSISPNKTFEKDLTLVIAKYLAQRLNTTQHIRVSLTRNSDNYVYPHKRSELAEKLNADMLISLHTGGHGPNEYEQISVWSYQSLPATTAIAQDLIQAESEAILLGNVADLLNNVPQGNTADARNIESVDDNKILLSQKLASMLLTNLQRNFEPVENSAQQANLVILAGKKVPSVLINFAYLFNQSVMSKTPRADYALKLEHTKAKLFDAIVITIDEFLLLAEQEKSD